MCQRTFSTRPGSVGAGTCPDGNTLEPLVRFGILDEYLPSTSVGRIDDHRHWLVVEPRDVDRCTEFYAHDIGSGAGHDDGDARRGHPYLDGLLGRRRQRGPLDPLEPVRPDHVPGAGLRGR